MATIVNKMVLVWSMLDSIEKLGELKVKFTDSMITHFTFNSRSLRYSSEVMWNVGAHLRFTAHLIRSLTYTCMKPVSLLTSLAVTAALITTAGIGISYAAEPSGEDGNPMSSLVSAIATKFNLDETAVQAVFDEQHDQMEADREQMFADRIAEGVTSGDLTQDQANQIQDKRNSIESLRESLDGATDAERRTAMKDAMDDLHQWAIDNNIPREYMPMGGHRGPGMHGMHFQDKAGNGATTNSN